MSVRNNYVQKVSALAIIVEKCKHCGVIVRIASLTIVTDRRKHPNIKCIHIFVSVNNVHTY